MSSSHFSAGKYCCLSGCTSSFYTPNVSLFVVPNGKKNCRYGDAADVQTWSEEFCRVLFNTVLHQIKILEKDAKMGLHISAVLILKKFIFREQVK